MANCLTEFSRVWGVQPQLRETFVHWYPAMQTEQETEIERKAA